MFSITSARYYLYREPTDMRKSFDGLCGLITSRLKADPLSGDIFIFVNKPRNRIKLLRWESGGFVIYFCLMATGETITISKEEYNSFLKLQDEVDYLSHQLAEMKRLIFGSKRERFVSSIDPQQTTLFDLPENEQVEKKKIKVSYERTKTVEKKQPLRTPLPAHLPRKTVVITLKTFRKEQRESVNP